MATEVLMPRQGNTVESCIILSWKKQEGDKVDRGEVLCEVETDKATFEVEAPEGGTLLKVLYPEGADVPVLELIAVLGEKGEDIGGILERRKSPSAAGSAGDATALGAGAGEKSAAGAEPEPDRTAGVNGTGGVPVARETSGAAGAPTGVSNAPGISPRARNLAAAKGLDPGGLAGSGPGGRIIERDVRAALARKPEMTPAAIAALRTAGGAVPSAGTGLGGRVTSADLAAGSTSGAAPIGLAGGRPAPGVGPFPGPVTEAPVQGIRKLIAGRMVASLQSTAQLTLTMAADARAILAYRERLKASSGERGVEGVNLNAIVLYSVARTLTAFPDLNAHFLGDRVLRFERVHLGFAVDTPRGLIVPVVREADLRSLKEISDEARRLATACLEGKVTAEELAGGTFTVTNLGTLGIEYFTPVLNPPQVGILGVGAVIPRPVAAGGSYEMVPHITLSLTIDHQAVDGAPGARFLRSLADNIAAFDVLLAG